MTGFGNPAVSDWTKGAARPRAGAAARVDPRAEEHLARVDVPEPRDASLIEEPDLDRRARAIRRGVQRVAVPRNGERVGAQELERRVVGQLDRAHDAQHAEAA